jgi:hypothetical protein
MTVTVSSQVTIMQDITVLAPTGQYAAFERAPQSNDDPQMQFVKTFYSNGYYDYTPAWWTSGQISQAQQNVCANPPQDFTPYPGYTPS